MVMDLLKQRLIEYGMDLGFQFIRVTTSAPLKLWNLQVKNTMIKDPESSHLWTHIKYDPKDIMPEAKSIVVGVWPHIPHKADFPSGIGRYSAYYREYPKGMDAIRQLGDFLKKAGYNAIVQPAMPGKEIAHRAGVGYFGKNALIHTKEHGSWISIHYILTDALLTPDKGMDEISDCGNCNLCMEACPTGAIEMEGQVTPSKCIRYHMLSSDFIPSDIREKMGDKMLGCDICQSVCPFNKKGILDAILPANEEMELFNIGDILDEWPAGLKNRMNKMGDLIGNNYARAQKILSTAIVLAGNSGDQAYVPALVRLLGHPHPPIRGHSAWAIGKIKPNNCKDILNMALKLEKDTKVIEEIYGALGSC
jgi:epoxyqueuosine reductase